VRWRGGVFPALTWALAGLLVAFVVVPLLRLGVATTPSALAAEAAQPDVRDAVLLTLKDAVISALLAVILGVPLAYVLARKISRGRAVLQAAVDLPLAVPHTVAGIALLFVLGRDGWIGAPLGHVGISFFGTEWGIVAAMLFVSVPFAVNSVRDAIEGLDPQLEHAARSLGASPWHAFRRVTLPLAARGILTGGVLSYARSISEFGAVVILAYFPLTAPVKVYEEYLQNGLDRSAAVALILLLVALSTFIVVRVLASGRLLR
jgi:molybdate/tungstate transport system permease protein